MNKKYTLDFTNTFKKDYKRVKKRGCNIELLSKVIDKLQYGTLLEEKYKDHALSGNWEGYRECHITPDWLLIYKYIDDILVLTLTRTGSHSDLF